MHKYFVRALLGGISFVALNYAAVAADMPLKAPPAAVQQPFSWTGFYGGLHAGGGWFDDPDATVTMQRFTGGPPGTGTPHALQSFPLRSNAFPVGGAQIGYNWQLQQQWLVGLEADFSGSLHTQLATQLAEGPLTDSVSSTRGPDWFGTVRGRLGYLLTPTILTYATGGLVYGHVRNDFTQTIVGPGPVGLFGLNNTSRSTSTGWTAGGGIEYALDRKWSVKVEYDYMAFNDGVSTSTLIAFNPGAKGNQGVFNVQAANSNASIVQIGLNYHFWN